MNLAYAIEQKREALLCVVLSLFGMLGIAENATLERIPRAIRNKVLLILRPAEAALRRLIAAAAHGVALKSRKSRPMPKGKKIVKTGNGKARRPLFKLEDARPPMVPGPPRRKFRKTIGIHFYPYETLIRRETPVKPAPPQDGKVDAARLMRRLQAALDVIKDMPFHVQRYLRWRARREKIFETRLVYVHPIRPGPPPYVHKKPRHEVEEILRDCHWLAWEVRGLDSS